jgi:cyclase
MLTRRIVACLDVREGRVVKGERFRNHRVVGSITELALRYRDTGADELVFYDIAASAAGRRVDRAWVERVARAIDIPFCVAGGIRSVCDAREILRAGADKVSINSPALARPALIAELAETFGNQCVVVGVDSLRDGDGVWRPRQYAGDPDKTRRLQRTTHEWVREAQARGAGEIVLNCMDADGVRRGFDIEQLRSVRKVCDVPLVASGGAGIARHFVAAFREADVDAALAAGALHDGSLAIPDLKHVLNNAGIPVRLDPEAMS